MSLCFGIACGTGVLGAGEAGAAENSLDRGARGTQEEAEKPWELRLGLEYHHLLVQNDLSPQYTPGAIGGDGDAADKNVLYYLLGAYWEPGPQDRFAVQWGVYQRFLVDRGASGFRSDDAAVAYTRTVPLPEGLTLRIQPRVDIGLSYESIELSGLVAAPRLSVSLERDFGPVNVYGQVYGYWYLETRNEYAGGAANPQSSLNEVLAATVTMPFLQQLEVGALGFASSIWYHQVQDDGSTHASTLGTTDAGSISYQPVQNTGGGEAFVRYTFPSLRGVRSDALVAYALGDPTIGYGGVLHDGVGRFNLFFRHISELYGVLTLRY
jgi:hypothetical protein